MRPNFRWTSCLRGIRFFAFALAVVGWGSSGTAGAQVVREDFHVANSSVFATALSGNTLYIGGDFTMVGPSTGGFVPIDATTGSVLAGFPKVNGLVYDMVSDGAGGWFIGGAFNRVGGLARSNLAHVLANNTVSPWNPNSDNVVYAMGAIGSTIYVGGDFSNVGGQLRNRIAAVDAATGIATAWDPNATSGIFSQIRDLVVSGSTVYVGGFFTTISGQARNNLAALDANLNLNNATAWNPNSNGSVNCLAISGTTVYAGGAFTNVGGQPRNNIAALDATVNVNNATAWNPDANAFIYSIAVSGTTVYAGGFFTTIGGQPRENIAALNATVNINNATAWNPDANSTVDRVFVHGTTVYASGSFTHIGGQDRHRIAALDATINTNNATAWNPKSGNSAWAFGVAGNTIYVGGVFTTIGGLLRNHIAAINVTTGLTTDWDPNADDLVRTLLVSGSTVYAAGRFGAIGGQSRARIAALDANVNTNNATAWNPIAAGNNVYALALSGTTMYVGGEFGSLGGQIRNRIGAVNTLVNTNNATAWNPNANNIVRAIAINGTTVYAGGDFNNIGGQFRSRIAALDATINTNNATLWNPSASAGMDMNVSALALSGTTVYASGNFFGIGGQSRNHIAALDATVNVNNATPWDPNSDGPVNALFVDGSTIYAGGFYGTIGGQTRFGMAALDANVNSNNATPWYPDPSSGANAFAKGGTTLYVGGFFNTIGTLPQSYLAAVDDGTTGVREGVSGPGLALLHPNRPNPFGASTLLRFSLARPEVVDLAVYDLAGREVACLLRGRPLEPGSHEVELRGHGLASGVYLSRLKVGESVQVRRMIHFR